MPNTSRKPSSESAGQSLSGIDVSRNELAMLTLTKIAIEQSQDLAAEELIASLEEELDETYRSVTQLTNELEQARMRLEKLSLYDDLTGLANRSLFYDRLEQSCELAKREDRDLPILMMDLNGFKAINDTFGHDIGDHVLREVAVRLEKTLRHSDTVARLGGDEFVALLPSATKQRDVITVVQKIVEAVKQPIHAGNQVLEVGISVGVAFYPTDGATPDETLSNADSAMYSAKEKRRSFDIYGSDANLDHEHKATLLDQLRAGIDKHQLYIEYQPKFNLETGSATGVEALVRWKHPEHGLIAPNSFIPAAEKTGIIKPLTLNVLEQAIEQAAAWHQDHSPLDLSVNVSARVLGDRGLPDQVFKLLERNSFPPKHLIIEMTETAFMKNPKQAMKVLERMHQMGIAISIDDFGTGYTSLMYLKSMPVNELKIDMAFIQKMVAKKNDLAIVQSIINLCKNLEITVVAEGVENLETTEKLCELKCDIAQGYFFARPLSADDVISKLRTVNLEWLAVTSPLDNICTRESVADVRLNAATFIKRSEEKNV